ncbi:MAG: polysaccharide deacetylase family protein [Lentisphaerae bacterium]|jgi:peptidoglycan-N-acetylglucosamine deacetylase|nr:polysaccharide deacetylase family protein [Lentisphaerota bacterium]MBT4817934.1 polysaccharide deacetylase family protein [Lentisphaerota bacterium]MBT5613050.1 polysaccharide deacetylase family protein [Lentisphaerota bacterium]MBT7053977.1 polysaccharide deacetylase family protein [Lentisphaerota bacterium]MBT7843778.1 polysaccharide deacetylase family protein [Lentisphaerota bacterium]
MPVDRQIKWPDGKRVAISLSFDDARASQVDVGVPILDRHSVKATFYIKVERIPDRQELWHAASANGHEMGNHSVNHACSGNFGWKRAQVLETYTLEEMEEELVEASRLIEKEFGRSPASFAYPCGQTFVGRGEGRQSYVPAVARNFVVGRGFRDEHFNDPDFCDLAKIGGTELDGLDLDALIDVTERAASLGAWVAFAGHDVGEEGRQVVFVDALDRYCVYCQDPANGVWIDTVETVGRYVREQREALEG